MLSHQNIVNIYKCINVFCITNNVGRYLCVSDTSVLCNSYVKLMFKLGSLCQCVSWKKDTFKWTAKRIFCKVGVGRLLNKVIFWNASLYVILAASRGWRRLPWGGFTWLGSAVAVPTFYHFFQINISWVEADQYPFNTLKKPNQLVTIQEHVLKSLMHSIFVRLESDLSVQQMSNTPPSCNRFSSISELWLVCTLYSGCFEKIPDPWLIAVWRWKSLLFTMRWIIFKFYHRILIMAKLEDFVWISRWMYSAHIWHSWEWFELGKPSSAKSDVFLHIV